MAKMAVSCHSLVFYLSCKIFMERQEEALFAEQKTSVSLVEIRLSMAKKWDLILKVSK